VTFHFVMLSMMAFHLTSSEAITDSCISNILTHALHMSVVMYDHRNTANSLTAYAENTVLIFRSVLDLKRPRTSLFRPLTNSGCCLQNSPTIYADTGSCLSAVQSFIFLEDDPQTHLVAGPFQREPASRPCTSK
jgi:hypothetical protein